MTHDIVIEAATLTNRFTLRLAGAVCRLATNSMQLGKTLRRWREDANAAGAERAIAMHVVVAGGERAETRLAHFRGLNHIVVASFGESNVFVFDLLRRRVSARVSDETAGDTKFWERVLLPIVMGVLGPAVGVIPVHAACLTMDGTGVLIAGASGAGKSTLSMALAQNGFDYISDDWTYLSLTSAGLQAHGMSAPVKLLPDALQHFPGLADHEVGIALNQEAAYEVAAAELGAAVRSCCEPQWFIFLERSPIDGSDLVPVPGQEALRYIEQSVERMPPELEEVIRERATVIERIAQLSCWKLWRAAADCRSGAA